MPLLTNGTLSQGGGASNALQALRQRLSQSLADRNFAIPTQRQVGARRQSDGGTHPSARSNAYVAGSAGSEVGARGDRAQRAQGGRDYLSEMRSAAADKDKSEEQQEQKAEQEQQTSQVRTPDDMFYADFEKYSDANLGGMSLADFLDTSTDEDRDLWRAFVDDDTMGRYYEDQIAEYGGFDPWYDTMTGHTIDDIMSDPELAYLHAGGSSDTVNALYDYAAQVGFVPEVGGDSLESQQLRSLYESDPALARDTMIYQYLMYGLNNQDDFTDRFSINDVNDMSGLDQMYFGFGDDFYTDHRGLPEEGETFMVVDPDFYVSSAERGWSSADGYGLPDSGLTGLVYDRYGAGYNGREHMTEEA